MSVIEKFGLSVLHNIDPELGHGVALRALRLGLIPSTPPITSERLRVDLAGMELPNPVGLAAGFDKNAVALAPLLRTGFGFIEVGAATPLPQQGNPKPRLFRLKSDRASINRFGFNNDGADRIAARLAKRPAIGAVGLNIGANKTSANRVSDYIKVMKTCGRHVDFMTINISSPNTEKLRDLQGAKALSALLTAAVDERDRQSRRVPLFVKIAPDLELDELATIATIAVEKQLDGIIATNTTLDRHGLTDPQASEAGGLSGEPLFEKSTRMLALLARQTNGSVPLIGVGGISSGRQAYAKIKAGATAVQLYTALVYHGFSLAAKIATELDELLARDGFQTVADAVGSDIEAYL